MAELTNYVKRKIQFKLIDYHTQVAKDRLHGVPLSMLVLQKDNLSDQEFTDFTIKIIQELKKKYEVKKVNIKVTRYHEILVVSKKEASVLPEDV